MIYQVRSLSVGRDFFRKTNKNNIMLLNTPGSTYFYGIRVIDCIFCLLKNEFPSKISKFIINTDDDHAAFTTARKLGYSNLLLTNTTVVKSVINAFVNAELLEYNNLFYK